MRRLWKWLRNRHGGFDYRYVGDLPANYPIPGTEFYYNGERGRINFGYSENTVDFLISASGTFKTKIGKRG